MRHPRRRLDQVLGRRVQWHAAQRLQQLLGHDRRVVGLRRSAVGVRCALGVLHNNAGVLVSDTLTLAIRAVSADTALGDVQRRRDAGRLLVWRDEVVSDVFDEDTLALFC